jgi:hypothetical protein
LADCVYQLQPGDFSQPANQYNCLGIVDRGVEQNSAEGESVGNNVNTSQEQLMVYGIQEFTLTEHRWCRGHSQSSL